MTALPTSRTPSPDERVLRGLLEVQERERLLVAYEIHDGLAQYLAAAVMHLEAAAAVAGQEQRHLVEGLRLVRAATDEARRLIAGLRPPALDELGLAAAIETLVADARIEVPEVLFTTTLDDRLPSAIETTVFRIVQEALQNVRRHAAASRASVSVGADDVGNIHGLITDDGCGFDPTAVPADRFGLEGIRQRVRVLGGTATITSRQGNGTTIDFTIPRSQ